MKQFRMALICGMLAMTLTSCYDQEMGMERIAGWWYMAEASEDTTITCKPCPIEMRFTHCTTIIPECPCTTILHGEDTTFYTPGTYSISSDGVWLRLGPDSFYIHEIKTKEITYGSAPDDSITWRHVLKRP